MTGIFQQDSAQKFKQNLTLFLLNLHLFFIVCFFKYWYMLCILYGRQKCIKTWMSFGIPSHINLIFLKINYQPVCNGHPWEMARWPWYTGWPLYSGQLCRKYKATEILGSCSVTIINRMTTIYRAVIYRFDCIIIIFKFHDIVKLPWNSQPKCQNLVVANIGKILGYFRSKITYERWLHVSVQRKSCPIARG